MIPRAIPYDDNPSGRRATARAVYEEDRAFASSNVNYGYAYADEVARLRRPQRRQWAIFAETYLSPHGPFLWSYPMANDRLSAVTGNWYCSPFAGRNPSHAGDPTIRLSPRKLGILLTNADWPGTSIEPMRSYGLREPGGAHARTHYPHAFA